MTDLLDDPLSPPPARPLWLITLADLALLLIGFFVLMQATTDRAALAQGMREGFDAPVEAAMPLAAAAASFARGSARLTDTAPLVGFARDAVRDPRVTVTVTGSASTAEGILLASDRARAVAAALTAAGVPAERLTLATAPGTQRAPARATLTLAFAGEPLRSLP